MTRGLWVFAASLLVFGGCDDATADGAAGGETDVLGDDMPDDFPAGSCAETMGEDCDTEGDSAGIGDSSASTAGAAGDCVVDGCVGQGVCAAPWDEAAKQLGEFECRFSCIPLLDDASWCANDEACCDSGARCTDRGYCVLDGSVGSTGSGTDSSGDTGTGTGSDTDTDTTSGSDTDTTGSDTDTDETTTGGGA